MAKSPAKPRALDVFWLLGEIDRKNYNVWDSLSEVQQKEFAPLVVMRWMAGTTDQRQLIFLNEVVNTTIFNLGSHKELLLKMLTVCSSGDTKRYSWVNYKVGGSKKTSKKVELIAEHYKVSINEAEDILPLLGNDDIMELCEIHGLQKDEIAIIKKELK